MSILTTPQQKILVSKSDSSLNALAKERFMRTKCFLKILSIFLSSIILICSINLNVFATEPIIEATASSQSYIPDADLLPSNDELFEGYALREFENEIYGETMPFGMAAANRLTGPTKLLYDLLRPKLKAIANGTLTSAIIEIAPKDILTKLSWTKKELGLSVLAQNGLYTDQATQKVGDALNELIDLDLLMYAMITDMPYDIYWFDKSQGISYYYSLNGSDDVINLKSLTFFFYVDRNYSKNDKYTLDPQKTALAKTAVANAKAIVEKYKNKSDTEKLTAYKNEICNLVTYNYSAAQYGSSYYGMDPWQLIYVFDYNSSTNVVCEGYSKAFQYLCDLSTFTSDVYCYNTLGTMNGESHMWNILEIDGKHYMADITNCDSDSIGYPDKLFLKNGAPSNNNQSYTFKISNQNIVYTFYDNQKDLFCDGFPLLSGELYIPESILDFNKTTEKSVTIPLGKSVTYSFAVSNLPNWMIQQGYSMSYRTTISNNSTIFYGANNNKAVDIKKYAKKVGTYYLNQTVNLVCDNEVIKSRTNKIKIKIKTPIVISAQPKTAYAKMGATAKVSLKATGDGLKYPWYYKNYGAKKYSKSSVTSSTYSVKMSKTSKNRRIYCVITDKYGNKLQTNSVILRLSATITSQPKTAYAKMGATAKVSLKATGDGLKYTWYYKNYGAKKYSKSSIKSSTYSCKLTKSTRNRSVYCVIKDKYGKTVKTKTVYIKKK